MSNGMMPKRPAISEAELWAAQAQFGPFDEAIIRSTVDEWRRYVQFCQRTYYEMSQPIIKIMAGIPGRPRMLMQDGKVISHEMIYTPEQEKVLSDCRKLLEELRDSIFGELKAQSGD